MFFPKKIFSIVYFVYFVYFWTIFVVIKIYFVNTGVVSLRKLHLPISVQDDSRAQKYLDTYKVNQYYIKEGTVIVLHKRRSIVLHK